MNDEIREILDYLKNDDYSPVFADEGCDDTPYKLFDETEVKLLLDYITNLQKENERLKEENKQIFSKVNDDELLISNAMNYAEAQDYKSRVEKAVEYIKGWQSFPHTNCTTHNELKNLLNILQNGSDNE